MEGHPTRTLPRFSTSYPFIETRSNSVTVSLKSLGVQYRLSIWLDLTFCRMNHQKDETNSVVDQYKGNGGENPER